MCFDMHQSEKLAVFVDDLRRNGRRLLAPNVNKSEAEFTVEQTDDGYAVRYALAGIRNVGEKAMEALVAERENGGAFAGLEDFFRRVPPGAMNRRQLEGLAMAGAFDALEPNRAKVLANGDMLLALSEAAERERSSGQAALFGGPDAFGEATEPALRLVDVDEWKRAEQMAAEREAFGFYFAAHPVEEWRELASANGARSYASLMEAGVPAGGRRPAVMAALVEGVSTGRTRRGGTFVRADFSDSSGQFTAACFEEGLVPKFQQWAEENTCVLLQVELDAPSPEEPPRVTVRAARPLTEVRSGARMLLTLDVTAPEALAELRLVLSEGEAGRGEVLARLVLGDARTAQVRLGRDFALDGELAERLASIPGLANVSLTTRRGSTHLRLVA
jgi:DNA polymerase-3 subunit alpha